MDTLIQDLRAALGPARVISDPHELVVYECDGLPQYKAPPRAVLFPQSTEEVAEAIRLLSRAGVPFVPRGAGTGLSGGALAPAGGVLINLARMRRLLRLDVENRLAVVEPGVVNAHLSRAAAPHGLHYAPDPSSQPACTIGGNVAENAGGIHCLKYGTTVDHVLAARVVLSDGRVVDLGGESCERPGYDLLGVFVGSEGTFGVATEVTVRLTPLPAAVRTLLADFTDIDDASRAVSAVIAAGVIPAALEMVDGATIRAVEASVFAAGLPLDAEAALLVELDGVEAGLDEETARVEAICLQNGARSCRRASDEAERRRLWAARKGAFGAMGRLAPDVMIQDAVVPRSRLPEVLAETYRVGAKYRLRLANVFHAGDGNLHPFISFDSRDADEARRVKEAGREIMETCVRAGGTITGEHGVGRDKREYLPLIFSDDTLRAMLQVRAAFDPLGLCNPGKVIPELRGCGEGRAVASAKMKAKASDGRKVEEPREEEGLRGRAARDENHSDGDENRASRATDLTEPRRPTATTSSPRTPRPFDAECALRSLGNVVAAEQFAADAHGAVTVEPSSKEEASELLKLAHGEGWPVVPLGAGTWSDACGARGCAVLYVRTSRLSKILEHEPADLVASAQAGATLADFNAALASAGQWLPLDPPGDGRRTLGGVLAAAGPRGAQSHAYGPARSHVLGMEVALADGRLIRVGGRVVKNVAGYDLPKLFVGSQGTLGLILEATFKLRPRPQAERTVVALAPGRGPLLSAGRAVLDARLNPAAAELLSPRAAEVIVGDEAGGRHALLLRFAGTREAVSWQTAQALRLCSGVGEVDVHEAEGDDSSIWRALQPLSAAPTHALTFSACVPAARLGPLLDALEAERFVAGRESLWHAGVLDGRLRVVAADDSSSGDAAELTSALSRLRTAARVLGGALVVERAAEEVRRAVGVRGVGGVEAELMRRVKSALDPRAVFSPGGFPSEDV